MTFAMKKAIFIIGISVTLFAVACGKVTGIEKNTMILGKWYLDSIERKISPLGIDSSIVWMNGTYNDFRSNDTAYAYSKNVEEAGNTAPAESWDTAAYYVSVIN
jgi:hypothetical protein